MSGSTHECDTCYIIGIDPLALQSNLHAPLKFYMSHFPTNYSDTIAMLVLKFSFYEGGISYDEIFPGTFGPNDMQALT